MQASKSLHGCLYIWRHWGDLLTAKLLLFARKKAIMQMRCGIIPLCRRLFRLRRSLEAPTSKDCRLFCFSIYIIALLKKCVNKMRLWFFCDEKKLFEYCVGVPPSRSQTTWWVSKKASPSGNHWPQSSHCPFAIKSTSSFISVRATTYLSSSTSVTLERLPQVPGP